jgi:hypothetical protein
LVIESIVNREFIESDERSEAISVKGIAFLILRIEERKTSAPATEITLLN